ncbi:MGMT family protein [Azotobacter chroococcum]|jgi:methylated-DNA-protein-cysteine methyltransferase-like protein|uniref:MGMT family protein n=1 Tax=Azotobacter chroococcum TaxID=353 RepID=A0A4Q9VBH1_9GAMM|nr:MGMT family protein [Azotobacter chroococcum]ASL25811.1 DNA base-flipping protein YbaZ [Azotobacter chroococcum]QQE89808.1 MGMT family protein [Azotobacter chroococcum]TBW01165.1 MGMT family protein [Azotobacter chroococcum]TBW31427.1 MGMT family protein [Azotobacter chroococcum]TKD33290.1 MGMT family protein [Azotobacter chroococcum]
MHPANHLNQAHEPAAENAASRRQALYQTLARVPAGQVISYGRLAELAGLGRAARWVGRILAQLPEDTRLPWHRVVAADGRLSLAPGSPAGDEQRARLRAEGLTVHGNRVDIRRHSWNPDDAAVRVRPLPATTKSHVP